MKKNRFPIFLPPGKLVWLSATTGANLKTKDKQPRDHNYLDLFKVEGM